MAHPDTVDHDSEWHHNHPNGAKKTPLAVILPYSASVFAIPNLLQPFNTFPKALAEAAKMDDDGEPKTLFRIVLPDVRASLASLGIFLLLNAWNEYMWSILVMIKLESAPIQIVLRSFVGFRCEYAGSPYCRNRDIMPVCLNRLPAAAKAGGGFFCEMRYLL